jgi:hypothetical protein
MADKSKAATAETAASACTTQNSSRPLTYTPDRVRVTVEDRGNGRISIDYFKVYMQIEITRSITPHIVHRKTT